MTSPFCSGRTTLCLFRPFDLGLMNPPQVPRNDIFKLSPDHGRNGECLPPSDHSECPWLCKDPLWPITAPAQPFASAIREADSLPYMVRPWKC